MKALVALACVVALGAIADARPGGGHSYSGGGYSSSRSSGSYRSSSGGGGSVGGTGVFIAFMIGVGVLVVVSIAAGKKAENWASTRGAPAEPPIDLQPVRQADPAFSPIVFEDFAFQLYSAAHRARHDAAELAKLAPYLSAEAMASLARRNGRVEQVVIGSQQLISATLDELGQTRLAVQFEANLAGGASTVNAVERWVFVRAGGVTTKPVAGPRTWPCPNCGAPWAASADRTCAHCGSAIEPGRFDWTVHAIFVGSETTVGQTLTGTVEEQGTSLPTVVDPIAPTMLQALRGDDPAVTWEAFEARARMIYARLNTAWNAQSLIDVRGLVTASLQAYLLFWIDAYQRQRLVNRLDEANVSHLSLAKVMRDPHYDAITVRVFADGLDYTLRGDDVVGGSKLLRRAYTEYWTFIRASARRGAIITEPKCPSCGAPLAISNAGSCTHCNAALENGSFDWVLSRIEQDDVYRG